MKPKFNIGDVVTYKGDKSTGKVVGLMYDRRGKTFIYQITSREVDVAKKELIDGVKSCREKELLKAKK